MEYEHGFQVNSFFLNWNRNKQNERYFRSLVGLRFYLKNKAVKYSSSKLEHFLVLYGSYLPHHYQKTNGWYVRNDNTYNYETADVSFSLRKIYVCYGLQLPISDFLSLEYIVGLGQKTRTVNYETSGETFDPWNFQWDEWISVSDRSEGTRHFLFPAITFRVIFKLFSVENDKKDEI